MRAWRRGRPTILVIAVYTGRPWMPKYGAHLENVEVGSDPVRVRLEPFREWACAGRAVDGHLATRALHAAVQVGNGDVVLLGGITGDTIDPGSAAGGGRPGGLLQPAVEVYDASQQRFRRVSTPGMEGFGRVLFGAVYMGADAPDKHRIRVVGGYELPADQSSSAVLNFDSGGSVAPLGAPFAPSSVAEVAPTVDLIYDSAQLTLTVQSMPSERARGAAITVSAPLDDGTRGILVGLTQTGAGDAPSSLWYTLDDAAGMMLAHQRLGATIDAVPALGELFVWGGDLSMDTPMVPERAGEILMPGAASTPISSTDFGLPGPVAFHSSTPIDNDTFVIAGGLEVEASGHLRATPASDPIFGIRVGTGAVSKVEIADNGYTASIFHTATRVPGVGVVITGGAIVDAGNRLAPVATVGAVAGTPSTLGFDDALPDLDVARWGHAATLLPGNRILITGGLARNSMLPTRLTALASAEILLLAAPPYDTIQDGMCVDQPSLPDGGLDAGPEDAGPLPAPHDGGPRPDGSLPDGGLPDGAALPDGG